MQSAYEAFQEGKPAPAVGNPHAAVVALERARDLEPDKASVRETLARAYFRSGRLPAAAAEEFDAGGRDRAGQRLRALRSRAVPAAPAATDSAPAGTSSSRWRCARQRRLPRRARARRRAEPT